MNKILSLLLLATSLSSPRVSLARSDYHDGFIFDSSLGLPTDNVPHFKAWHVKGTVLRSNSNDGSFDYYTFEAIYTLEGSATITNCHAWYLGGNSPTNYDYGSSLGPNFANDFYYSGEGLYDYANQDLAWQSPDALDLAYNWVDPYIRGTIGPGENGLSSISEYHDGSSFYITCDITNSSYLCHYEIRRDYSGAILPTRNFNDGRDEGPLTCDDPGMPHWSISEPYLNLWVRDTPVFYKTSLGQQVGFTVDYKQRDTRPKKGALYGPTGWNHNWYSYVHLSIPVEVTACDPGQTNIVSVSARGFSIRGGWTLSGNWDDWQAILYAPNHSESYFSAYNKVDPQNQRTLVPLYSSGQITGFRLVNGDGSQDIYSLVITNSQPTYGPVDRYGYRFDKAGMTNGMAGVWTLSIAGAGSPHKSWQDAADAACYDGSVFDDNSSFVQQCGYYDGLDAPSVPVAYLSSDALLTARVDPYGNAITLGYAGSRLSTITDYDGNTNNLSYDTNGYLSSVAMPYGRTAHFNYDTNGNLLTVTDAQGMTSTMTYAWADAGLNFRLTSLTTPYGTTQFGYVDDTPYVLRSVYYYRAGSPNGQCGFVRVYVGEADSDHAIIVTHPDLSKELYAYCGITNGSHVPASLTVSQAVLDAAGGAVDHGGPGEASLQGRNCFHWDRSQTPLLFVDLDHLVLTNLTERDFRLGTWKHYPLIAPYGDTTADLDICPSPTFIREGSPDGFTAGNITWFTYDTQSPAWQVSAEPSSRKQIVEAPDGTALKTSFNYDYTGLLTSIDEPYSDENGGAAQRTYNFGYATLTVADGDSTFNLMVPYSFSGPGGSSLTLNWPDTTTVNGNPVLSWPIVDATDSQGNTCHSFFNDRHQLSGIRYANGLTVTNLYGGDGFLQKSIAVETQATNTYVFQNGELVTNTTPLGLTVGLTHDHLGRLTSVNFPDGTSVSYVFDKLDVVAAKDRLGHWSYAGYDSMRQLSMLIDSNGGTNGFSYCDCGALTSVTNAENQVTTYGRDYLGRVTSIETAVGTVSITRDSLGRATHVTSWWGVDLHLGHNYQGLLTAITNPAGTALSVVYDEADRPVSVTDARGVRITSTYDSLGRLLTRSDPLGQTERNEYSVQGLWHHYDGLSNPTSYDYDSAGRLSTVTNPNQEVTQFGYDLAHRRASLTDGRNQTKWWAYDMYGRVVAETNANGVLVRTNGYDANSRLTAQWTRGKGLTTVTSDNKGNILSVHYPHATINYTYDYLDRLSTMSDALGSHSFAYTNFGAYAWALASETDPWATLSHSYNGPNLASTSIGSWTETIVRDASLRPHMIISPAGTFTYGFNGASGQLNSLTAPGSTTGFGYDELGELSSIGVTNSSHAALDYHGYEYNLNGWITTAHRLGGVTANYLYDNIGQVTSAQAYEANGTTLRLNENLGYTYDASGNLATRSANTLSQTFTSDALNQLSGITRSGTLTVSGSITGAVATLGVNGTPAQIYSDSTFASRDGLVLSNANNLFVTAGSNGAGQLVLSTISSTRLPATFSLNYDANGNLTNDGQRAFEYDDASRLAAITVSNAWRTEFGYDGLGRRRVARDYAWQGQWAKTNETRYVCDGFVPLQERDTNGNVLVTYTRGLDISGGFQGAGGIGGLLARTDASGSTFYHADVGGNITSMTDSSGNVSARYLYDPFGRPIGKWGPMADANVMQFSSMPVHRQSGLSLYPFRGYDPGLQRFINQDPIGEAGGMNVHGFVGNNPVSNVDPYGLWSLHDYLFQAGQGLYDMMMGDESGRYNRNMKGSIEADMGLGIDRDNNVLRDSMGGGLALLGDMAEEAAIYYLGNKVMEAGLGIAGVVVCKAKPLLTDAARAVGGKRMSPFTKLAKDEIELIKREFSDLGGDVNKLRFARGVKTGFVGNAEEWEIIIGGDILPLEDAIHPRSAMSIRAVLAHELGHHAHRGTSVARNAWNDELRASYWAAKNLVLSTTDKTHLILDAISRAAEKNVRIRLNSSMTDILTQ